MAPPSLVEASTFADCQDARLDAIVVGAGVTGLSTALHLAERGGRVAVLERSGPGQGTTGASNGQVIAGLQEPPDALLAAYGERQGERLIEFSGGAPERLFELVRRHAIDCDAERTGWIQATRSEREMKSLGEIADAWIRRGAPVRLVDAGETARLLGTGVYAGGWHDERNGTIQPLAYARGLAEAARAAGAMLCHPVRVIDVVRDGARWSVETDRGSITVPAVVLATNVYTSELEGVARTCVSRSYLSAHSVQLATAPLSPSQLEQVLPERHSCGDTSHVRLRYFRLDRDNRFVIGGPGWLTPPRSASAISFRLLESSMRRMFPALAKVGVDYRWAARDTLTADLLPHLYEPAPGLFSALGFNGRGLAIGTALGSVLASRIGGESADSQPFPTTDSSATPFNLPETIRFYARLAWARLRAGAK